MQVKKSNIVILSKHAAAKQMANIDPVPPVDPSQYWVWFLN